MSRTIPTSEIVAEDAVFEHLLRGEVVIFAGDGIAEGAPTQQPDMQSLVETLQDGLLNRRAPAADNEIDPQDAAQWYADEHGHQHVEMRVRRAYDLAQQKPSALQRSLMGLPVHLSFTTSYDQMLEQALADQGIAPHVIIDDLQCFQVNDLTGTTLIKLYGCISLPDSLVLTRDDFDAYVERHRAMVALLQSQLTTRTVLFVGINLLDPRVRALATIIRQSALLHHQHAFALHPAPLQRLHVRQWAACGVECITFENASALLAFLDRLRVRIDHMHAKRDVPGMLHTLHADQAVPVLASATSIEPTLESLRRQVRRLLGEASRHPEHGLEMRQRDAAIDLPVPPSSLRTVQTLYRFAETLETCGVGLDREEWRQLANGLYRHRDWTLAIRAYTAALRTALGSDPWTEGDIARVYLRLGRYARAEGLLRQLVFIRSPDDQALDILWLVQRPTDLIELGYAVSQRAAQLRDDGKAVQALGVLKEMRPWLRKGVGMPWMMAVIQDEHGVGSIETGVRSHHPVLLTCYGANYRLAYELSVSLRHFEEANRLRRRAVRLFVQALQEEPGLFEPRAHLIEIYSENLLQRPSAAAHLLLNIEQVEMLAASGEHGQSMRDALRARYARAWKLAGLPTR